MKLTVVLKSIVLIESVALLSFAAWTSSALAETPVYRCGNEYVASIKDSKNGGCKLMEGGQVTVVQGTRVANAESVKLAAASPKTSSTSPATQRNDSAEQKSRDSDSRSILETELKKAETKQAELLKEYNSGEPEKNALDLKNPQRYVDRLAEMKANIARNDSDITGIKRELGRNTGSSSSNTTRVN